MATNAERRSSEKTLKLNSDKSVRSSAKADGGTSNGIEENGLCHNSRPCYSDEKNGSIAKTLEESAITANGELSPSSLRRSTRICALKAAEKIKLKESISPFIENYASNSNDGYYSGDGENEEPERPAKKRRVASRFYLDQFDCKFGVKFVNDEVLLMSDESEISSLNEEEIEQVKKVYEKNLVSHSDEQAREIALMVKKIEEELRLEEAKLAMLKTLKKSQQVTVSQIQEANMRKLTANIAQNGSGTAYKPPVATPQGRTFSHNSHNRGSINAQNNARTASLAAAFMNLPPQQQQLIQQAAKNGICYSAAAQILLQAHQQSQANGMKVKGRLSSQQQQQLAALAQQHHSRNSASVVRESPAQKAAAAKLKLRRELEQHLLRIPPPRPPPPDMHFIPNANQPDFCALLGLDIAVQRLLKEKNDTRTGCEQPYVCEECGTDFTPVWRAIGTNEEDLHLFCENCVKASQKRKMRQEHTALLRKELERVMEKEQELEKQIAEGKYDTPVPSTSTSRVHTPVATPPPGSHSKISSAGGHGGVLKSSASTSAIAHHHSNASSHKSNSHKRPATSTLGSVASPSTAASIQSAAAAALAAASSTGGATLLQQQMASAAALRQMNPMLATMMANPLFSAPNVLQWPAALMQQQRSLPNLTAMAALLNAAQNVQQSNASTPAANPLAALAAINPAVAAMFANPQMVRQYQQVQKNLLMEYAKQARK